MSRLFLALVFCATLPLMAGGAAGDVSKIVGPEACGECHKDEVAVWKETHHSKGFFDRHRSDEALAILEKLGSKRGMKRDKDCKSCHYTEMIPEGKTRAKPSFGISCESCHGAALDWIDIHNDYGGKDVKREQETPEHKAMRRKNAIAGGMIHPDDIYSVAANCYSCHTVPNERIVNLGGHKAGSEFDLVSWSQGEIRHNFFSSDSGKDNLKASQEKRRQMLLVGRILDVEYSLRSLSKATVEGDYAASFKKRTKTGIARLVEVQAAISDAKLGQIIDLANAADLKPNNEAALLKTADSISELAKALSKAHDGTKLAALDSLVPGEDTYKGQPFK